MPEFTEEMAAKADLLVKKIGMGATWDRVDLKMLGEDVPDDYVIIGVRLTITSMVSYELLQDTIDVEHFGELLGDKFRNDLMAFVDKEVEKE